MPSVYGFGVQAFGCNIRVAASCADAYAILERYVFPSFPRLIGVVGEPDLSVRLDRGGEQFQLTADGVVAASACEAIELVPELVRVLDEAVIKKIENHMALRAVHAGAVLWGSRVLLLPGITHAGKSSLVAELLRRGATYFSDEYALIDAEGRVHPYPRPLLVRNGGPAQSPMLAEECNAPTGDAPASVGWILSLEYVPDGAWSVTAVSQSEGVLTLLRNTPHLLAESPDMVGVFERAVAGASCYSGRRNEAAESVGEILRLIDGGCVRSGLGEAGDLGGRNDNGAKVPLETHCMEIALTIAGFDPSSGAGVTADLMVFAAHGLFGTSCITGLTVQSTVGVVSAEAVGADLVRATLECLWADLPADGIKIGMLASGANVVAVADFLRELRGWGVRVPVVLDPVLRSSSGRELLDAEGVALLREQLLPLVDWVTPNVDELGILTGRSVLRRDDLPEAAQALQRGCAGLNVFATGGHLDVPDDLVLVATGESDWLAGERIETTSTHGTGCALSSALLCRLVMGDDALTAAVAAKGYVTEALRCGIAIGKARGPVNHLWGLRR